MYYIGAAVEAQVLGTCVPYIVSNSAHNAATQQRACQSFIQDL